MVILSEKDFNFYIPMPHIPALQDCKMRSLEKKHLLYFPLNDGKNRYTEKTSKHSFSSGLIHTQYFLSGIKPEKNDNITFKA